MSIRRRIEGVVAAVAVIASVSLLPGIGLAASPDPVGAESPLPSGATESPAASSPATRGYATPEDAVNAYLAGVAANDFNEVLAACALDEMAKGYRFDLAALRLNAFVFSSMWAPATNAFYVEINRALQQGMYARAVMFLSYSLLLGESFDPTTVISPVDEAQAQQFIDGVDPAALAGLKVLEVRFPKASLEQNPRMLKTYAGLATVYGADEWTERAALVFLDGKEFAVGLTLIRYGSAWAVANPSSPLFGTPPTGLATPTTLAEFEDQTSS